MFFKKKAAPAEPDPMQGTDNSALEAILQRIEQAGRPGYAEEAAKKELEKLEKMDPVLAEYAVGLNYLELLLALPWNVSTFRLSRSAQGSTDT